MKDKTITLTTEELAYITNFLYAKALNAAVSVIEDAESLDELERGLEKAHDHAQLTSLAGGILLGKEKVREIHKTLNAAVLEAARTSLEVENLSEIYNAE